MEILAQIAASFGAAAVGGASGLAVTGADQVVKQLKQ